MIPNSRVIAIAGTVEKVIFEGSYEECGWFADFLDWEWSGGPGGFVWSLEVECDA